MSYIQRGSSGNQVVAIQQAINRFYNGCVLADDGVWGPITDSWVNAVQQHAGLTVTSVFDQDTAAVLNLDYSNPAPLAARGSCVSPTSGVKGGGTTSSVSDGGWTSSEHETLDSQSSGFPWWLLLVAGVGYKVATSNTGRNAASKVRTALHR